MTDDQFNSCRTFLEKQIEAHPDNHKLIDAYMHLITALCTLDTECEKAYQARRAEELKARESRDAINDKAYHERRAKELEAIELTEREAIKSRA